MSDPKLDVVTFPISVRKGTLINLLTSAETACEYWATLSHLKFTTDNYILAMHVTEDEEPDGDREQLSRVVTAEDLVLGLQRLAECAMTGKYQDGSDFSAAGKHFTDALTDDGDLTTADVVLQMTVFGEIVYG